MATKTYRTGRPTNVNRVQKMLNAVSEAGYASLVESTEGWQVGFIRADNGMIDYGNHTYWSLRDIAVKIAYGRDLEIYGKRDKLLSITALCKAIHADLEKEKKGARK